MLDNWHGGHLPREQVRKCLLTNEKLKSPTQQLEQERLQDLSVSTVPDSLPAAPQCREEQTPRFKANPIQIKPPPALENTDLLCLWLKGRGAYCF